MNKQECPEEETQLLMHGRKGDEKQMATKTNAKRKTKSPSGFARKAASAGLTANASEDEKVNPRGRRAHTITASWKASSMWCAPACIADLRFDFGLRLRSI